VRDFCVTSLFFTPASSSELTPPSSLRWLYIEYEAYCVGVELDDMWKIYGGKEGATEEQLRTWKVGDESTYPNTSWPVNPPSA
jgi:hypothetical protein